MARHFAQSDDCIDFGNINLSGVSALTIHARVKFDESAFSYAADGVARTLVSQWGAGGNGFMLGISDVYGRRNIFWLLGNGTGAFAGAGSTGDVLSADVFHSLIVTWSGWTGKSAIFLDNKPLNLLLPPFNTTGLNHVLLNAANLSLGQGAGQSIPGFFLYDLGAYNGDLTDVERSALLDRHPSCTVAIDRLIGFTDPDDTTRFSGNIGKINGTTVVDAPKLLSPYAILIKPETLTILVAGSVKITTAYGPYGSPSDPVTIIPLVTGGVISPTSGTVGTTFTFTAGIVAGSSSITFNDSIVNITINALPAELRSARVSKSGETILLQFKKSSDGTDANLTAFVNPIINVNHVPILLGTPAWLDPSVGNGTYPWVLLTILQPNQTVRIIDDQDSGFTATGASWQSSSGWYYAYKNQHMYFTAGASDTASWTFTGLSAGTYEVAANWTGNSSFTSQARYTINGGTSIDRDQRQGSTGLSTKGVAWSILGNFTIIGDSFKVQVSNAAGAGTLVADAVLIRPVVTPIAIRSGDVVTLTASTGWAMSAAGAVNPYVDFVIDNAVGIPFAGEFETTTKRMQVGYNVEPAGASQLTLYSNLYTGNSGWGDGPNQDGRGNLLDGQGGGCVIVGESPNGVDNRSIAVGPGSGRYKFRYPAGSHYILGNDGSDGSTITVAVADHEASDGKREVEYDIIAGPNSNVAKVDLYCYTSTGHDIEIYGPDPLAPLTKALTPDSTHPWNPHFLQALRDDGVKVLRGLDLLATNNSTCIDFADLSAITDDHINPNSYIIYNTPPIASIGPTDLTGGDDIVWFGTQATLKVTFTAPHGLRTGQTVVFQGMPNLVHPAVNASGPVGFDLTVFGAGGLYGAFVWVYDATTVIMSGGGMYALGYSATPHTWAVTETPPVGQTWYFRLEGLKAGLPPELFIDLCNRVDATPYYNIPHLLSDVAVAQLADVIFAKLAPGLKIRFEYTNEPWNFGFNQFSWCNYNGYKTGYGPYSWYGYRAAQVFAIIRGRAKVAGRENDVIYVIGTHQGNSAITSYIISGVNVFDPQTQIDEVAGASYQDTVYMGVPLANAYINDYDVDQMVDIAEASAMLATNQGSDLGMHHHYAVLRDLGRTVLDENGCYVSGTRMIQYEGGPQGPVNNGYGPDNWIGEWSHRVYLHPRFRDVALAFLQRLEDQGVSAFHRFIFNGLAYWSNGTCWGTYWAYGTKPGLGDGSDGLFDNRTNPEDPRAVSVFGSAMKTWNSLCGVKPIKGLFMVGYRQRRSD